MLDQPSSSIAAWRINARTGIRPEYLYPVLFSESGFRTDVVNSMGYSGLNQISAKWLSDHGISRDDYITWTASHQMNDVVLPFMGALVRSYGPIKSGARLYQGNFMPATLKTAKALNDVIVSSPSKEYTANKGLDKGNKGTITVGDMAAAVAKAAAAKPVKDAIAAAYALRPEEVMRDPVYGEDFSSPSPVPLPIETNESPNTVALVAGAVVVLAGVAAAVMLHHHPRRIAL